jgi:nickel transport protein
LRDVFEKSATEPSFGTQRLIAGRRSGKRFDSQLRMSLMKTRKKFPLPFVLAIIFLLSPLNAFAHRVSIFAWIDGDTVHTESKFSGSKMVKGGTVKVFDMENNLLLEGTTDDNGGFSFGIPKRVPLRLELAAGAGHGNEWSISADEIGASAGSPEETQSVASTPSPETSNDKTAADTRISREEMEEIVARAVEQAVEKAVDQKMKPVMKILSDMSDSGPKMSDIVGGIGYIIGLVGIGAYFGSRRKAGAKNS